MAKFIKKISKKIGKGPHELVHIGEQKIEKVRIRVMDYDKDHLEEKELKTVEETFSYRQKATVSWINIDGLHDIQLIETLTEHYGIHPLVASDIVNTEQRPKMEDFGDYIYVVLKMLYYQEEEQEIIAEQMSFVIGNNFILSFQERKGDVFEPVRERLRNNKGRIRKEGNDYLLYSLMDAIVDHYFLILEKSSDHIEQLEEKSMEGVQPRIPHEIHTLKRNIIYKRKQISPLRELLNGLLRGDSKWIRKTTHAYFRDIYDHVTQILDTIESYRDILSGLHDIYLSNVSNRMNEIMKVLTVFAALFIPLTFIAGVYGMNFEYMPELHYKHGYFVCLGAMSSMAIIMLVYFKRRNWF